MESARIPAYIIETVDQELLLRNVGWGYDRIVGALANLSNAPSGETVANILRRIGSLDCEACPSVCFRPRLSAKTARNVSGGTERSIPTHFDGSIPTLGGAVHIVSLFQALLSRFAQC